MTEVDDPQGNAVKINYDGQLRITQIVDAAGQKSTICYANSGAPCTAGVNPPTANNQVTEIIDPFGRFARFGYDAKTGHLITITDVLNITSTYQYGQSTPSTEDTDFRWRAPDALRQYDIHVRGYESRRFLYKH